MYRTILSRRLPLPGSDAPGRGLFLILGLRFDCLVFVLSLLPLGALADGTELTSDPATLHIRKPMPEISICVARIQPGDVLGTESEIVLYDADGFEITDPVATLGCTMDLTWDGDGVAVGGHWYQLYVHGSVYVAEAGDWISDYYFDAEDFSLIVNGEPANIFRVTDDEDEFNATFWFQAPADEFLLDFRQGDVTVSGEEAEKLRFTLEQMAVEYNGISDVHATYNEDGTVWFNDWDDGAYDFSMEPDEETEDLTFHFLDSYNLGILHTLSLNDSKKPALLAEGVPYFDYINVIPGWETWETVDIWLSTPNAGEANGWYWDVETRAPGVDAYSSSKWYLLTETEWGTDLDWENDFETFEEGMTYGLGVTVTSYNSFLNDDTQYVIHDSCGRESAVMLIRNDAPKEQSDDMISYGVNNYDYFLLAYTVTDGVWISSDPQPVVCAAGQPATFSVSASGGTNYTYLWQQSADGGLTWTDCNAASADWLVVAAAQNMDGYLYRCVVTDGVGNTAVSKGAQLRLTKPITSLDIRVEELVAGQYINCTLLDPQGNPLETEPLELYHCSDDTWWESPDPDMGLPSLAVGGESYVLAGSWGAWSMDNTPPSTISLTTWP